MARRILVVNGWSNAGKTSVTRWLSEQRGFDRVDTDEREIDSKGLRFSWTKVENGDATALRDELVSRATDTVFDWPYTPPGGFALVLALQAAGVPVWWFDADPEAAKQSFDARAQGNLKNPQQGIQANFASLRRGIESWHTVLLHLYGRRFLRTLFAGGTRMPPLRIWDTICAVEGWTP
ncbi:MAG: ATP-binding protein [Deltaproteobacteria bacterium]|nr:MAG: ATP-binding protein [Deltaproteobacteria bacterium]